MSHNITVRMDCSIQKLQNKMVQDILEKDFKWKVLPKGVYRGWASGGQREVAHDIRIAIPSSHAPNYSENISKEEAARFGLPADYKIIAVQRVTGETKTTTNEMGETIQQKGPESIGIVMDAGGSEGPARQAEIKRLVEGAISAAQAIQNMTSGMAELASDRNVLSASVDQIRQQMAGAVIANQNVSIQVNFS